MRCFFALPLPVQIQQECRRLRTVLQQDIKAFKWVAEGNFHITLKFIGEVSEEQVPLISEQAESAFRGIPPLKLSLEGVGTFPDSGKARVIWIRVQEEEARLPALAGKLDRNLSTLGIPREARAFFPHVTIGRARPSGGAMDRRVLQYFSTADFVVPEIFLYKSSLMPAGPIYSVLKKFPLF